MSYMANEYASGIYLKNFLIDFQKDDACLTRCPEEWLLNVPENVQPCRSITSRKSEPLPVKPLKNIGHCGLSTSTTKYNRICTCSSN